MTCEAAQTIFEATPEDQRLTLYTALTNEEILEPTTVAGWELTPLFEDDDPDDWIGFRAKGYGEDISIYAHLVGLYDEIDHLIRALKLNLGVTDDEDLDFSHLYKLDPEDDDGEYEDIDDAALVEEVLDLPD